MQWYLDVLFLKIVGYHKGSDASITDSPGSPFGSALAAAKVVFAIFVTVDSVLASPPSPIL